MSPTSTLNDLAKLVAQTSRSEKRMLRSAAGASQIAHEPSRQKVGDLLGTVLALASRTRRLTALPVRIELDVFSPAGRRAATIGYGVTQTKLSENREG